MKWVAFIAWLYAAAACRDDKPKPPPPPPPVDGIELVAPGAAPHRPLRYALATGTTTPLELAMDVDLRTLDVTATVPTMVFSIDLTATEVDAAGTAKLKMAVVGARVKKRGDDPKDDAVVTLMERQLALLPGLVLAYSLAPNGAVSGSKIDSAGRDLSGPVQEQVTTLVQMSEQIAMALPAEPVGIGAKWKHRRTIKQNQLTLLSITTVELTAIDGNRISLQSTSELTGADQTITQDGATAQVTNLRGSGSQTGTLDLSTATLTGELRGALSFELIAGEQRRPTRFESITRIGPRADPPPDALGDAGASGDTDAGVPSD